jgi:hypothetical protein
LDSLLLLLLLPFMDTEKDRENEDDDNEVLEYLERQYRISFGNDNPIRHPTRRPEVVALLGQNKDACVITPQREVCT